MSADDARKLEKETAEDSKIHVMEEDVEEHMSVSPPTKLKNPALFQPFEMFVEMYGLPAYQEMDPTIFIALTYLSLIHIYDNRMISISPVPDNLHRKFQR